MARVDGVSQPLARKQLPQLDSLNSLDPSAQYLHASDTTEALTECGCFNPFVIAS